MGDGSKAVVFQVLDDHSRYWLDSLAATGETNYGALAVVRHTVTTAAVPQKLLSDYGPALDRTRYGHRSLLVDNLCALGVDPITGRPNHPRTKGENEGPADRDIIGCLKRHVANDVFALLTHPSTEPLPGPSLRRQRQALDIRLTDVAATLGVPYQRLRRLELGTRTAPDLVHRCQHSLDETDHQHLKTAWRR